MHGTLYLISTDHNHPPLRTPEVRGEGNDIVVGQPFTLKGVGLAFGTRLIHTSLITTIDRRSEKEVYFNTENSAYRWVYD